MTETFEVPATDLERICTALRALDESVNGKATEFSKLAVAVCPSRDTFAVYLTTDQLAAIGEVTAKTALIDWAHTGVVKG